MQVFLDAASLPCFVRESDRKRVMKVFIFQEGAWKYYTVMMHFSRKMLII